MASWRVKIMWLYWNSISRHQPGNQGLWSQIGLPSGQGHTENCVKMASRQQSQCIGLTITKPWPQSNRHFVGRTKSKEAYKLTFNISMKRNGPKFLLWKLLDGWPSPKLIKSQCYQIRVCDLLAQFDIWFKKNIKGWNKHALLIFLYSWILKTKLWIKKKYW